MNRLYFTLHQSPQVLKIHNSKLRLWSSTKPHLGKRINMQSETTTTANINDDNIKTSNNPVTFGAQETQLLLTIAKRIICPTASQTADIAKTLGVPPKVFLVKSLSVYRMF